MKIVSKPGNKGEESDGLERLMRASITVFIHLSAVMAENKDTMNEVE